MCWPEAIEFKFRSFCHNRPIIDVKIMAKSDHSKWQQKGYYIVFGRFFFTIIFGCSTRFVLLIVNITEGYHASQVRFFPSNSVWAWVCGLLDRVTLSFGFSTSMILLNARVNTIKHNYFGIFFLSTMSANSDEKIRQINFFMSGE